MVNSLYFDGKQHNSWLATTFEIVLPENLQRGVQKTNGVSVAMTQSTIFSGGSEGGDKQKPCQYNHGTDKDSN